MHEVIRIHLADRTDYVFEMLVQPDMHVDERGMLRIYDGRQTVAVYIPGTYYWARLETISDATVH